MLQMVAAGRAPSHAHTFLLKLCNLDVASSVNPRRELGVSLQALKHLQSLSRRMKCVKSASKNGMLTATACLAQAMYHASERANLLKLENMTEMKCFQGKCM
jgi:hypothetical protein